MLHIESKMQIACVRWFRLQFPQLAKCLISIPNGGQRGKYEAAIMKAEGIVAGASDLFLFVPSKRYHGLAIEMKTAKGRQSPSQKEWQQVIQTRGYHYIVVRSFEQFVREITAYLG